MRNFSHIRIIILCAIVVGATVPLGVLAHSEGASLEGVNGEYRVDIGYNPERISAGDSVVFDFSLTRGEEDVDVDFDSVWVRASKGNKTVLATGLNGSAVGKTVLTYVFPEEGVYELDVRFQDNEDAIAQYTFSVPVDPSATPSLSYRFVALLVVVGGVVGGSITMFFLKKKK